MERKQYYKKIFAYFKNEKINLFIYVITSLFIVGLNTLLPILEAKSLGAITAVHLSLMMKLCFIMLFFRLFDEVIRYFNSESSRKIQNRVEIKIKEDVSKELFDLEMKNFDKEGTGFFSTRIESEPAVLSSIFSDLRFEITSFFTSIGVFFYIFYISPILGCLFVVTSLLNFYIHFRSMKRWKEERKKSNEMEEKYASNFGELIRGIKDIKVLNLKNYLIKKTTMEQKELSLYRYEMRSKDQKSFVLSNVVHIFMNFLFIVIGISLIQFDMLTGADLLVIYMYKGRAIYFLDHVNRIYRSYKKFNLSLERLYEVIDGVKYSKEKFGTKKLDHVNGCIEFKNVSFGYENHDVFQNVNFKIEACETIGIVGKSGVGKTTIINLINKLYSVMDGSIFIDGVDINEISEDSLRENITTITQNPYIFNMTIRENLKIVDPEATDEEIEEKCKLCAMDEYINSLPQKYDTLVGEKLYCREN